MRKPVFGVPTRSHTNQAVQPYKITRGLKFRIYVKSRDCTIYVAKTKSLISCAVTAQLICVFVFAYAKGRFYHNEAQLVLILSSIVAEITPIIAYAPSEVSDQPCHIRSLIREHAC